MKAQEDAGRERADTVAAVTGVLEVEVRLFSSLLSSFLVLTGAPNK